MSNPTVVVRLRLGWGFDNNKEFLTAVSNMMSDLADLFADLGGDIAAEEIRKQENFTKKMIYVVYVDFAIDII